MTADFETYWARLTMATPALKRNVVVRMDIAEFRYAMERAYTEGHEQATRDVKATLPPGFDELFGGIFG